MKREVVFIRIVGWVSGSALVKSVPADPGEPL
jgi:hypothetical protein